PSQNRRSPPGCGPGESTPPPPRTASLRQQNSATRASAGPRRPRPVPPARRTPAPRRRRAFPPQR
ncbi:ribbon-helix-helix protein, CopG family, partial [Dysosmobacter welbionis]